MTPKGLPLPLGGSAPAGARVAFWRQPAFRVAVTRAIFVAGLLLAVAGAYLGLQRAPVTAGIDAAGYHVDGTTLAPSGPDTYTGDAALAIRRDGSTVRAAADGRLHGETMRGVCTMTAGAERCDIIVGGRTWRADDTLTSWGWRRHYQGGPDVDIRLADARNPVPVPFPIGLD